MGRNPHLRDGSFSIHLPQHIEKESLMSQTVESLTAERELLNLAIEAIQKNQAHDEASKQRALAILRGRLYSLELESSSPHSNQD